MLQYQFYDHNDDNKIVIYNTKTKSVLKLTSSKAYSYTE